MNGSKWVGAVVGVCTAALFLALPLASHAGTCVYTVGECTATVTTSIWTGEPTIVCQEGDPVIRIDVSFSCGEDLCGGATYYRCGSSTESTLLMSCAKHVLRVASGYTWLDSVTNCNAVTYWNTYPL